MPCIRIRIRILIAVLLLALAQGVFADSADDWLAGQQAFQSGDFSTALHIFQRARDDGLEGPAVHYNIAVCHFELGAFAQAGQSFQLIADRFPLMRGLAEYNLGLVASRLGETTAAREHFLSAYELSPNDEKLRILSSTMLREQESIVAVTAEWSGVFGFRVGHDDNVALREEAGLPVGVTAESPMADLFASVQGPSNGLSGFRLDASVYLINYFDADEFNQAEIRGGVTYDWRPADWRVQAGGHFSVGSLGGDAFDRKAGASVRVIRSLNRNASVDLRYIYDDISEADSVFAGIAGSRQQFDARYRWHAGDHRMVLRYQLETNDRADASVSPRRNRVAFSYRYQPETGWGYEGGVDIRASDYSDLAIPRDEDLFTIRGAVTRTLPASWLALLEFRHTNNDSSDDVFSYDSNQITLGMMKLF